MTTRTKRSDAEVSERLARRQQNRTNWRDGQALRRIEDATEAAAAVDEELAAAVHAARDEGYSWTVIGLALGGISKQAAQQRFAT
jgi:hypothetical protein